MKFTIEGADAKSGHVRKLEIDADDERSAIAQAKEAGVFPYDVKQTEIELEEPKGEVPTGRAHRRRANQLQATYVVLSGAVVTIAFAIYANSGPSESPRSVPSDPQPTQAVSELSPRTEADIPARRVGEAVWLSRSIVAAKDLETLKKVVVTIRDNDEQAFAVLILRGDAVKLTKGTRVTVSTIPRENGTYLSIRPEGSPDELWVLSVWLQ